VTGYAQIFLGERLSARQWAEFATVFAGVVMLSLERGLRRRAEHR